MPMKTTLPMMGLRNGRGELVQVSRAQVQRGLNRGLSLVEIASGGGDNESDRRLAACCRQTMREAARAYRQRGLESLLAVAIRNRDLSHWFLRGQTSYETRPPNVPIYQLRT
jgi:hypothetical protein